MVRSKAFRTKQRNVFAGELKEICLFAGLGFVGDDNEGGPEVVVCIEGLPLLFGN
jgi:hypothetical protein